MGGEVYQIVKITGVIKNEVQINVIEEFSSRVEAYDYRLLNCIKKSHVVKRKKGISIQVIKEFLNETGLVWRLKHE